MSVCRRFAHAQVTTLSDFFDDETVFVAFGAAEKYAAEQLTLSDDGISTITLYL